MAYKFNPFTGNLDLVRDNPNAGDIDSKSYTIPAETGTAVNVDDLLFSSSVSDRADIVATVLIDATADLKGTYTMTAYFDGSDWNLQAPEIVGDDCLVDFSITSAGQVQYTTDTYAGFTSGTIKFRATTINS